MKAINWCLLIILVLCFFGCTVKSSTQNSVIKNDSTAYYKAKCDSLTFLSSQYEKFIVVYENERTELTDSIIKLNNRPLMTKVQFLELYKYERLLKYYIICKNKPTQWKFYKGWSIRGFEQ